MSKKQQFAHELIAATAKEFAGAFYEELALDDAFFSFYPSQKKFIRREWPRFVEAARLQLSKMLGMSHISEFQKEQIFDALLKHSALPGNVDKRIAAKVVSGKITPETLMMVN